MKTILGIVVTLTIGVSATAQNAHSSHSNMTAEIRSTVTEPGQSAFAAIAEITELLRKDASTDWSRVDIEALRQHLVNMELVTLGAEVETELSSQGVIFEVSGDKRIRQAIQAMVPAHAPFLEIETGWKVVVIEVEDGVTMQVSGDANQILALNFIGLMTIGAHHPEHHLSLARGITEH